MRTGNADTVLSLTCVGTSACITALEPSATPEQIKTVADRMKSGVDKFAEQLDGAQFGNARKGSEPGTMEVPYRSPRDESFEHFMSFVEFDGKWLYFGGGGSSGGSGGAGSPATSQR